MYARLYRLHAPDPVNMVEARELAGVA